MSKQKKDADMEHLSTGAGLGALGFWLFVAAVVAAGVWDSIRKRDAQHETLRRVIESGQPIDDELVDKLLSITGGNKTLERDMKVSGLIMMSIAPGLGIFGWLMSLFLAEQLLPIMLAVAALLLFMGLGFLGVGRVIRRWNEDQQARLD